MIYWRHPTVPGIKVEEVTGGEQYRGAVWLEVARQVYCENGRDEYREIGHYPNGAPFLYGSDSRISITHCQGLFAVATLAPTPDIDLSSFSSRSALGIDAERCDRQQVIRIRERFLSPRELDMIPENQLLQNVQAWTAKEAVYKAALKSGLDFRQQIEIIRLPLIGPAVPVFNPEEFGLPAHTKKLPDTFYGEAKLANNDISFELYTYLSDEYLVTLAYTSESSRFGKDR